MPDRFQCTSRTWRAYLQESSRNSKAKATRRFSAIPIVQEHEQKNELVKGTRGAVGLIENPPAFKKMDLKITLK